MLFPDGIPTTEEPTDAELDLLRKKIDPQGFIIGE
jgi:hypothetical protein